MFRLVIAILVFAMTVMTGLAQEDATGIEGDGDYSEFTYAFSFGVPGDIEGAFRATEGIALGPDNQLYIADSQLNRISIFNLYGEFVGVLEPDEIAGYGTAEGPYALAFDDVGHLYVSDIGREIVTVLDTEGNVVNTLEDVVAYSIAIDDEGLVYFVAPLGIRVFDAEGEQVDSFSLYDEDLRRMTYDMQFDAEGNRVMSWIKPIIEGNNQVGAIGHVGVFDSEGSLIHQTEFEPVAEPGQSYMFSPIASVIVGTDGYIYAQGKGLHVIDPDGAVVRSTGGAWGLWQYDSVMVGDFIYFTAGDHVEVYSVQPDLPFWEGTLNGNARFRGGPGTTFDVVGTLPQNTRILVYETDETGEWYRTRLDGEDAWVASFLVNE
jgi:hypothetical protein